MGAPRYQQTPASAGRLFALTHDLMGALDLEGRLVWTNPAWEHLLGRPTAELAGASYLELLHPDDRQRALAVQADLAGGRTTRPQLEVRVLTSSGQERWVLFNAVYAPEERLLYISGKDVSVLAERELLHSRYRALVSNLPDTVVTLFDADLRIVVVEGAQLARRGLDAEEYAGRTLAETMPADQYTLIAPRYRAALDGEPQTFDIDTPDGAVTYRVQAVPLYDEQGRLLGGMSVSRDVTVPRRQERTMAQRTAELERSNAELAQFAYVASHDLSEPLRMISSYLQLLRRRYHGQIDEDADAFIGYAVDGAARMRTLIEDLLAYSRAGRSERPTAAVDTGRVVAEVAGTLHALAGEAQPRIEWEELPTVEGDAAQLAQLFQNLIGNGVKFVAPGVRPHVRISAEPDADGWRFSVDDNGIGIDERHAERVFGMFQRLHTRDEFEGTGIGLAIARKVVERHGGRITAAPLPDGGSCFTFTLPAREEPA
jgi:PAS domain S-box-containing protein